MEAKRSIDGQRPGGATAVIITLAKVAAIRSRVVWRAARSELRNSGTAKLLNALATADVKLHPLFIRRMLSVNLSKVGRRLSGKLWQRTC